MTTHAPAGGRSRRRERGFTLTEVLIATLLVSAAIAATNAFFMTARAKTVLGDDPTAHILAEEIFTLAQLLPREVSGATGMTDGSQVAHLDHLIGASFSPPIMANGQPYADLGPWAQQVSISIVDITAPGVPTNADPQVELDPSGSRLYLLEVEVFEDGASHGTFTRLMAP